MKTSLLIFLSLCILSQAAFGEDWPHWRGPHNNGHSSETGLPDSWSPERRKPAVAEGRVCDSFIADRDE